MAVLQTPINLLYDRFDAPLTKDSKPEDNRTAEQKEASLLFSFMDPRLQHLKPGFTRESLQIENISFVENQDAFRAALDEIIKFNCYVNEFNYMQEFYARVKRNLLTVVLDPQKIFTKYDTDQDDLLKKDNLL